jgi:DNA-binding NarL/FixJ family response regulator
MNMTLNKNVLIADDHLMFRQGLKALLESNGFNVIAEASNGHEAIRLSRQLSPAIAILDFAMPMLNGIDAAQEIHKQSPRTQVVMLTMHEEEVYALEALKAGIRGYVLKSQTSYDLINAILEVVRGAIYMSPKISETVVKSLSSKQEQPDELLTCRERQVLQLIAEGKTTKDIATVLNLSVKTAESHRSRIMQRLDMHNIASLVRYAIRRGMIQA